ncbi:MAG: RagB/SusD family nutrient uptake outer membrane protein [Adhaeribacter sp.]
MKFTYKSSRNVLAGLLLAGLLSCSKNELELLNPNDVTLSKFFTNEEEATIGLAGVYDAFQYRELAGEKLRQLDVIADNAQSQNNIGFSEISTSNHNSAVPVIADFWAYYYNVISRANLVIDRVNGMPESAISEQARKRTTAEAAFLRAYAYLDLTTLFGDIPFYTQPASPFDEGKGKTAKADIHAFIIQDLQTNVIPHLPATTGGTEKGRVTSWAAKALLGKYYLFDKNWPQAAAQFKEVIDSKAFSLYPDYAKLFTPEGEYSPESLFEIGFVEGGTDNGENFSVQVDTTLAPIIPSTAWRPAESLVNSYPAIDGLPIAGTNKSPLYKSGQPYDNRDPRLRATIYTPADVSKSGRKYWNFSNTNKFAVRKYSWYTRTQYQAFQGPQNYYLIRYADVLLMYAEAQNEAQGADASVYEALTAVRKRAGLLPGVAGLYGLKAAMTQAQMRTAIRDERRWELALEHQRYFDIIRWGIAETVLNSIVPNPKNKFFDAPRDYLWPYPQTELDNNPTLKSQGQNPGW